MNCDRAVEKIIDIWVWLYFHFEDSDNDEIYYSKRHMNESKITNREEITLTFPYT